VPTLERFLERGKSPWAAEASGFDVHAGVSVRAAALAVEGLS
jgi:hypothetical protein